MTYSSGSIILAADYNGFVGNTASGGTANANLNDIWAVGSTDKGWGQTAVTNVVASANTVTATQWASLVNNLATAGTQTNTTLTSRTAPVAGNIISILANVNTDLTNVTTNRGNAAARGTQYTAWTGTNSKTAATAAGSWTITITNTITFPSADQARYFWNAGGLVKITCSKTSTGATGDPPWNALATACGDIYISGRVNGAAQTIAATSYTGTTKVGGSGTTNILTTTTGWYTLVSGAAATAVFKQFSATAPYTSDFIQHTAAVNAGRTTLTIVTTWVGVDGDPISGGTAASGATPGTAPCTIVTYFPPSATLTNSWGTPTVAATTT
jgi:hypothetical protein